MAAFIDHYAILGIKSTETPAIIRSAYRRLALLHHPDKARTPGERDQATATFGKIATAHGILSDTTRRKDYDAVYKKHQRDLQRRQHKLSTRGFSSTTDIDARASFKKATRTTRSKGAWKPDPDLDGSFDTGFGEYGLWGSGDADMADDEGGDDFGGEESREQTDYGNEEPATGGNDNLEDDDAEIEIKREEGDFSHAGNSHQEEAYYWMTQVDVYRDNEDMADTIGRQQGNNKFDPSSNAAHFPIMPDNHHRHHGNGDVDGNDDDDDDDEDYDSDHWAQVTDNAAAVPRIGDGVEDLLDWMAANSRSHRDEQTVRGRTFRGAVNEMKRYRESCALLSRKLDDLAARFRQRVKNAARSAARSAAAAESELGSGSGSGSGGGNDGGRMESLLFPLADIEASLATKLAVAHAVVGEVRRSLRSWLLCMRDDHRPAQWLVKDCLTLIIVACIERDAARIQEMESLMGELAQDMRELESYTDVEVREVKTWLRCFLSDLARWKKLVKVV